MVDISINNHSYIQKLSILEDVCVDLILGLDFQTQHQSVVFTYGGDGPPLEISCDDPPLKICGLTEINVQPPELFANRTDDCHPIATMSCRYSKDDIKYIECEVAKLLKEGVIEDSKSPWRAQVVVTRNEIHKKRLVMDYSQTINKFTLIDAYPLPRVDDTVNRIAQYSVYSTIDLKSVYHQIPINEVDKPFTAFEAAGGLHQFRRMTFGVTNGVSCFRRIIDKLIQNEGLSDTFTYLDNVFICRHTQTEHDENLDKFITAAERWNLTCNPNGCIFSTKSLTTLGYIISNGEIKPDPEHLRPLRDLPLPHSEKSLKRCIGLFSRWIYNFSDKISHLVKSKTFPLGEEAKRSFEFLKLEIENAVIGTIDENLPFVLEPMLQTLR